MQNNITMVENKIMSRAEYEVGGVNVILTPGIVKRFLVSGQGEKVTDQEVGLFMQLCKANKVNPFLREAYLVKYGSLPATMITGKETFTKREMRNPNSNGHDAGIIVLNSSQNVEMRNGTFYLKDIEKLVGGWADVYRKDKEKPIKITVNYDEYVGKTKEGKVNSQWSSKPATMIRKVALVQALREAFPEDFQGMYSPEEIVEVDYKDLDEKPIDPKVEKEKVDLIDELPKMAEKKQKQLIMDLGNQKGLANDKDIDKLEKVANDNGLSLRKLTYEDAIKLIDILEKYEEVENN